VTIRLGLAVYSDDPVSAVASERTNLAPFVGSSNVLANPRLGENARGRAPSPTSPTPSRRAGLQPIGIPLAAERDEKVLMKL
jgi:hypothetical protein